MKLSVFETYETLSRQAANEIVFTVIQNPDAVLCLAGGDSPLRTYEIVVQLLREKKIDFSNVHFIGLDEWVGIAPENPGSCQFFLKKNILEPLAIQASHMHLFNALSEDMEGECTKMKKAEIVKKTLEECITESVPASLIRRHANSLVFLDTGSASKLSEFP